PIERPAPHVVLLVALRLRRIDRRSDLLPTVARRAVKLDAEVPVVERRITTAVAAVGQRDGDIVTQEIDRCDLPLPPSARDREQTFARRNEKRVTHHHPPDRA